VALHRRFYLLVLEYSVNIHIPAPSNRLKKFGTMTIFGGLCLGTTPESTELFGM